MKIAIALSALATFTGFGMALDLPDPLVMKDGTRVTTRKQWEQKRRPELKELFQEQMYGHIPPKPKKIDFKVQGEHDDFLGGKAVLKNVTISFGSPEAPKIDLLVISPKGKQKSPAFLVLNFCGNHAITDDKRVPLLRGWAKCSPNNRATDADRGTQANDWPLEEIVARGYALATFCNSDPDSDRADVSDGVYKWLDPNAPPQNRGTIAAWAWGFHRAMDYLVTDKAIDAKRVATLGHSRNGKTALLAAAMDERFALAIPHQAGCGGTAPSRGKTGESVQQINKGFPHWFNAEFKKYNDAPEKLPFDQNCLVALMAPRPVLFSNAQEDRWANPSGQFEVLKAAEPVYKLLKAGGLEADKMPELGKLVNSNLGYFIRPGKHSMTKDDWKAFLEFADKHL
ncbi:MAG TPA: acetylxylan esterase [Verrucomicrobiae bacterium]|nr:acetylxylan esterase [Verrucomicrobiae bacterium]